MTADVTSILARAGFETPVLDPDAPPLEFFTMAELTAAVIAEGSPRFLIRGLWPAGAYGVYAAEPKAGKTWGGCDLAVAVAASQPWLGMVPTDVQGTVLMFVGEGGKRNILRRLRAVADFHGVDLLDLPLIVCPRVPHLSDAEHLRIVREKVAEIAPVLVVLDPLYLAARSSNGTSVYEMGAVLEQVQQVCEPTNTSLVVVHHWNRKEGSGAARMSGAGPAEWGRVLLSAGVRSKNTDPETKRTRVILDVECSGGEIADQTIRFQREVWADDPDDLASPLRYTVSPVEEIPDDPGSAGLRPAARMVLAAIRSRVDGWSTVQDIGDYTAEAGHPYKTRTIQAACKELEDAGLIVSMALTASGAARYKATGQDGTHA